jgi:hypothetical protein
MLQRAQDKYGLDGYTSLFALQQEESAPTSM